MSYPEFKAFNTVPVYFYDPLAGNLVVLMIKVNKLIFDSEFKYLYLRVIQSEKACGNEVHWQII